MVRLQPECWFACGGQILVAGIQSRSARSADVQNKAIGEGGDTLLGRHWRQKFGPVLKAKRVSDVPLPGFT